MKTKKTIAALMAAVITLSFSACGEPAETLTDGDTQSITTTPPPSANAAEVTTALEQLEMPETKEPTREELTEKEIKEIEEYINSLIIFRVPCFDDISEIDLIPSFYMFLKHQDLFSNVDLKIQVREYMEDVVKFTVYSFSPQAFEKYAREHINPALSIENFDYQEYYDSEKNLIEVKQVNDTGNGVYDFFTLIEGYKVGEDYYIIAQRETWLRGFENPDIAYYSYTLRKNSNGNLNIYSKQEIDNVFEILSDNLYITIKDQQYRTDLTKLELHTLGLTNDDILPLKYMTNLETLYLSHNEISDISPLSELTNLKSLSLNSNQISDISALSGLKNLSFLNLRKNQISDISPLSALTNLTSLPLGENQISDISALKGLTNLTDLSLDFNKISDISPLSGLKNLDFLALHSNQISDISPLSRLTELTYLTLEFNQISDISALSGLINLNTLELSENQISDVSPLSGLSLKNYLLLSDNQISDITPLKELVNLTQLSLYRNPISEEMIAELKAALPNCQIYY